MRDGSLCDVVHPFQVHADELVEIFLARFCQGHGCGVNPGTVENMIDVSILGHDLCYASRYICCIRHIEDEANMAVWIVIVVVAAESKGLGNASFVDICDGKYGAKFMEFYSSSPARIGKI